MRALLGPLVALMALSLAACNAPQQSAEEQAPPEASAPAEPPPPPTDAPAAAPTPEDQESAQAPEAAPPTSEIDSEKKVTTRSLAVRATPVIVEVDRTQERRAANGGSAVVLFSEGSSHAYRNTVTCVNVWNLMDTASTQEVRIGIRKAKDGTIEALRPLYWLNRTAPPAGEQTCDQRLARYDYARAKTIRDKYGLAGAGPYFVVARTDERAAAVIDLTGRTDREIAYLVEYFRDGFAFQSDIWDPARNEPARKRSLLASFFGTRFRESLVASLGFISSPAARAGCRLGDLRDAACT